MGKTVAKIIAYVLVAFVIVGVVGLIYKFTNGFNEDFKTFYIEYNGKQILTTESKLTLEKPETHTFTVKYTFDNEKSEPKDYKVKITPNVARDFDYTVNGEKYLFSKTGELTAAFGLNKELTRFSLTLPYELNLQKALQIVNDGKNVVIPANAEENNPYPYRLTVASYNDKVIYHIDFKITDAEITGNGNIINGEGNFETPTPPAERGYNIEYLLSGDITNLTELSIDGATQAKVDETISFTITIGDENYTITGIRISVMNADDTVTVTENNGVYSFIMPQGNIYVWIYFEYTASSDKVTYGIEYDTLGSGSNDSINFECVSRAVAGDTVTFTVTLKEPLEITRIVLNSMESGEEIRDLGTGEGTFTFTMPEETVTVMIYLMTG